MKTPQAFSARREQLEAWKQKASHPTLQNLYDLALHLTEQAEIHFVKLVDAADGESKRYADCSAKALEDLQASSKELEREIDTRVANGGQRSVSESQSLAEVDRRYLLIKATTLQMRGQTLGIRDSERAQSIQRASSLCQSLTDSILTPEPKYFSKAGAVKAIGFGVGLVPILGPAVDFVTKTAELARRDAAASGAADEHLEYLDGYCYAIAGWCSAAAEETRRLDNSVYE